MVGSLSYSDDEKIKNGLELEMEDASSSSSVISNSVKELSTLESLATFSATKSSVWVPEVLLLGFLFIYCSSFLFIFFSSFLFDDLRFAISLNFYFLELILTI